MGNDKAGCRAYAKKYPSRHWDQGWGCGGQQRDRAENRFGNGVRKSPSLPEVGRGEPEFIGAICVETNAQRERRPRLRDLFHTRAICKLTARFTNRL